MSPTASSATFLPRAPAGAGARPARADGQATAAATEDTSLGALLETLPVRAAAIAGVLIYAVLTVITRLDAPGKLSRPEHIVLRVVGDVAVTAALGWGAAWLASRFPLERLRRRRTLAALCAGVLALGVAGACVKWLLLCVVYSRRCSRSFGPMLVDILGGGVLEFSAVFLVIAYGLQYARRHRARELAASRLSARLADARLAALKAQLHPHFLFNTFHSVSALMQHDPAGARAMLRRLTALLEVTLERAGQQEVTLAEELRVVEMYAGIEGVRFSDRLSVHVDADPGLHDALVPHLLLQPLVENAVKHGIAARPGPGRISISARAAGSLLLLRVEDDGPGAALHPAPDGNGNGNGNGIGLANTRARLEALHGAAASLRVEPGGGGGTTVTVTLPLRRSAEGAA
ncbi:MAG TPA: histidine kinase [Longimicrobium sp.]|nr:histidine kinase [Longimicrobium sp.]